MPFLRFRLPGRPDSIGSWLAALFPSVDRATRRRWIEEGRIRLDGRVVDRPRQTCPSGSRAEIEIDELRGEAFIGAGQGDSSGSASHGIWYALVDRPPWRHGTIELDEGRSLSFSQIETRGDLACLALEGAECTAPEIGLGLANASMPVVGDLRSGGLGVAGGARLVASKEGGQDALRWPDEVVWRPDEGADRSPSELASEPAVLHVSDETSRALQSGHPWILPDDASEPATRFRPGSLVRIAARSGGNLGWAHVEASPRLSARLWGVGDVERRALPSVESRVAKALAARRDLLSGEASKGTNACRLIHGEGDGFPGLFVDRLGPLLRVLVSGWACEGFRERTIRALRSQMPLCPEGHPWSVLELLHLRSSGTSSFERVRWIEGGVDALGAAGFPVNGDRFFVEERGLQFAVDPGWAFPSLPRPGFGLFLDQRENRERLVPFAKEGGRWLNLFAHTGAFSVALLAAGAESVVSVDLSGAYLERLDENLRANSERGVEVERHRTVRGDARHYLEALDPGETFRGIVIDPPTAAAAGRRFWSVKQDLEPLLDLAIERLAPGGVLLVTQNRSGPPIGLDRALERSFDRSQRTIETLVPARAGVDHPSLSGFPEGESFEGWLVVAGEQ